MARAVSSFFPDRFVLEDLDQARQDQCYRTTLCFQEWKPLQALWSGQPVSGFQFCTEPRSFPTGVSNGGCFCFRLCSSYFLCPWYLASPMAVSLPQRDYKVSRMGKYSHPSFYLHPRNCPARATGLTKLPELHI